MRTIYREKSNLQLHLAALLQNENQGIGSTDVPSNKYVRHITVFKDVTSFNIHNAFVWMSRNSYILN